MSNLVESIKSISPLAYKEFEDFMNKNFKTSLSAIVGGFEVLDFPFQLGVFLDFFNQQSIEFEIDLINYNIENIKESIVSAFVNFEKVIGHFS